MSTKPSLTIKRRFNAPPAKVFRAWTDPAAIKRWFVHHANVHWERDPTVDLFVNGTFQWSVISDATPAQPFAFHGSFLTIAPPNALAFTWEWQLLPIEGVNGAGNTLVTIELVQKGAVTDLALTQRGLPSEAARVAHERGWARCFDGIQLLLEQEAQ